jgi:hypothetical protein
VILELAYTPASYNETRYAHWAVARRHASQLRDDLWLAIRATAPRPVTAHERITASAVLTFPTRRRRDTGNFRTPLEKALGDALQEAGVIPDDTPDLFAMDRVRFATTPGPAQTIITLDYETTLED